MTMILRCDLTRNWRARSTGVGLPSSRRATRLAAMPISQRQRQSRPGLAINSRAMDCRKDSQRRDLISVHYARNSNRCRRACLRWSVVSGQRTSSSACMRGNWLVSDGVVSRNVQSANAILRTAQQGTVPHAKSPRS